MNIEFHYYITYLIAAKAGFSTEDAHTLAYSSQYVDDNYTIFEISKDSPDGYRNFVSQTKDIIKPENELIYIYLLFHYIPGDPLAGTAARKDGKMHWLITTPDSENANKIFQNALESRNLYHIGIACHSFADTFAHQNFVGLYDEINSMNDGFSKNIPAVGHALTKFAPDWPALTWMDPRLMDSYSIISNKERFKTAAGKIYKMLRKYIKPEIGQMQLLIETEALMYDLEWAIGDYDDDNSRAHVRLERYNILSVEDEYGGQLVKDYNKGSWLNNAALKDNSDSYPNAKPILEYLKIQKERYTWKDPINYKNTDWYKFQEAVKNYQNTAWNILYKNTFSRLELDVLL